MRCLKQGASVSEKALSSIATRELSRNRWNPFISDVEHDSCPCLTCSIKITQVGIAEVVYSLRYGMDEEVSFSAFSCALIKTKQLDCGCFRWSWCKSAPVLPCESFNHYYHDIIAFIDTELATQRSGTYGLVRSPLSSQSLNLSVSDWKLQQSRKQWKLSPEGPTTTIR